MAIEVRIPTILRTYTGGNKTVEGSGATLGALVDDLDSQHPGLKNRLVTDEGKLHRFVNVYVNDEDVRFTGALDTEVKDGDSVTILPGRRRRLTSPARMAMARFASLVDSLGGTPLVGLPSAVADRRTSGCGPSSRTATPPARSRTAPRSAMIDAAEKDGLAAAGRHDPRADQRQHRHLAGDGRAGMRGYRLICVMPENTSVERRQLLEMYGAQIIYSPAAGGSNQAVAVAKGLAAEHADWVMLYQYGNPANAQAHYETHRPGDPRATCRRSPTSSPGSARRAR